MSDPRCRPYGAIATRSVNVSAVLVTFNPDLSALETILAALRPQVGQVVIVDNGSAQATVDALIDLAASHSCLLEALSANLGIGAAQNRGVAVAAGHMEGLDVDEQYLLFLDHDSIPAGNMVERLMNVDFRLRDRGVRVGGIGPVIIDRRTGTAGQFVRAKRFWVGRVACASGCTEIAVDFLISSGTMVRLDVFRKVGEMNEGLFIDHVDTDWCLRAAAWGYRFFGACDARLTHSLGDDVITVWVGRWREVFVHSPLRDYYMCRNTILILRELNMSITWRIFLTLRLIGSILFFGLAVAPRGDRLCQMRRGLADGLSGRDGSLTD